MLKEGKFLAWDIFDVLNQSKTWERRENNWFFIWEAIWKKKNHIMKFRMTDCQLSNTELKTMKEDWKVIAYSKYEWI